MATLARSTEENFSLASDIFIALRRANRAVTHLYDSILSPTGVKATQVAILQRIRQHGEIAQWQLADTFGVSDESLSRRLATLRSAGLVVHRISNHNHKERIYQLTSAGSQKCEEVLRCWRRAEDRLRKTIGNDRWNLFLEIIGELDEKARAAESLRCANGDSAEPICDETFKPASASLL